jgi:hypothetical protein
MTDSNAKKLAQLLDGNGDVLLDNLDNVSVTPTAVSDQPNTSTGGFTLPAGTEAQRPGSPDTGETRYNSESGSIEFYDGTSWISTNLIPTLDSVSGTIFETIQTTLTLTLTNATDTISVLFTESGSTIATVSDVSVSSGSASVSVPAAVYGQSAGDTMVISITNQDGTPSSNTQSTTIVGLPTGGSRTIDGATVYHSFSAGTSTLSVPSGFSANDVDVLIVAGGGGGGCGNGVGSGGEGSGGGGGGAGGLVYWGGSESAFSDQSVNLAQSTNYTIVVGTGGTGAQNEGSLGTNGGNSTAFGFTALGGGGASSHETQTQSSSGGSGGGAHDRTIPASGGAGIQFSTYSYGYGNNGGDGQDLSSGDRYECGAGGGGAGAVGQDCNRGDVDNTPGNGGAGRDYSSVFGTSYGDSGWFAGGGGGGGGNPNYTSVRGTGGQGGGGNGAGGSGSNGSQGTDGTGGGGGGGHGANSGPVPASAGYVGYDGGDGIVLVKYTLS